MRDLLFLYNDRLVSDYTVLQPVVVNFDGMKSEDDAHSKVNISVPTKCIDDIVEESGYLFSTKLFRRSAELSCMAVTMANTGVLALVDKQGKEWSVSLKKLKIDDVEHCRGKAAVRFEVAKKVFQKLGKRDEDLDTTLEKGQWVLNMLVEAVSVTDLVFRRKKIVEKAKCIVPAAQGNDGVDAYVKKYFM